MLARGGDFADGIVQTDATRARCRHIVTFDRDFARLLDPDGVVLLGVEQSSHPFTAPAVSAPTMNLCSTRNVSIAGSADRMAAAASRCVLTKSLLDW